jgi:hypothetical protein
MIDNKRAELLDLLQRISAAYPEMRMGQLLCNLAEAGRGPEFGDVWEVEDEELIPAARQLLAALEARTTPAS